MSNNFALRTRPAKPFIGRSDLETPLLKVFDRFAKSGTSFETYRPAYRYGYDSYAQYPDRNFDEIEGDLRTNWERSDSQQSLAWEDARPAVRDSYDRTGSFYNERVRQDQRVPEPA